MKQYKTHILWWKGGAMLHDGLHATGPDLLCNTTVRTQSIVPASLTAPGPARPRPCACDNHQKDTAILVARRAD